MSKTSHGSASMGVDGFREFAGATVRALPADLPAEVSQFWVERPAQLRQMLREGFLSAAQPAPSTKKRVKPAASSPAAALETLTIQVTGDDNDQLPKGWKRVVEDSIPTEANGPVTFGWPSVHQADETYLVGETLLARSVEQGGRLGLRAANALVRQQAEIPVALRGKVVFVFTGIVAEDPSGYRRVAYVDWDGGRWILSWRYLDGAYWDRRRRPVRSRM